MINAVGHAAGALLFATFLYLAMHRRVAYGSTSRLSMLAATLALLWNIASLAVIAMGAENSRTAQALATAGFSLLSFLPAVLLHLCIGARFPTLVRTGYALSAAALASHVGEFALNLANLHRVGLVVITAGFGALTVYAVVSLLWTGGENRFSVSSRTTATMLLFLFAISFAHFGDGHIDAAWSHELLFHHAGIPLALFVLLRDLRFVLADALIRVVANGFLAVLFGWLMVAASADEGRPVRIAVACFALGGFGAARAITQNLLTRLVFRQPSQRQVEAALAALRSAVCDETQYLRAAGQEMARLMNAPLLDIASSQPTSDNGVAVPIRVSPADTRYALLGERRGGRPYLSLDLDILARLAEAAAQELERIRTAETERLAAQAELSALQAQINPHFLFNALNTLYATIPDNAVAAKRTLLDLADIFRYFLRSERPFVRLEEELRIVKSYLAIEEQRLGGRLRVEIAVDHSLLGEQIPALSIEPLVENAVKHGVSAKPGVGTVRLEALRDGGTMLVSVSDTGPGFGQPKSPDTRSGAGVGLDNVSRRLHLCGSQLRVEVSDNGTRVSFRMPCRTDVEARKAGVNS